jgi:hypothetical protein
VWRRKTPWFGAAAAVLLIGGLALGYSRARVASAVQACVVSPGYSVTVGSVGEAQMAIQNGASNAPTGRAKAEKILKAAQLLKSDYQDVVSKASGADKVRQIADLYKNRTFWIELMERIHATLPQASPEVAAAKTSADYIAALTKIPRNQRKAIYIDEIQAGWVKDTALAFATGSLTGGASDSSGPMGGDVDPSRRSGGGGGAAAPVGGGPKGFALILKGRTSYGLALPEAVVFLSDWARKFKDIRGQSVQFYVDKVETNPQVLPITQVASAPTIMAGLWAPASAISQQATRANLLAGGGGGAPQPAGGGGGGEDRPSGGSEDPGRRPGGGSEDPGRRAGGGGGGPAYSTTGTANALLDPLTGEPTNSDYVFQLKLTVVLGASPEKPAEAAAGPAGPAR